MRFVSTLHSTALSMVVILLLSGCNKPPLEPVSAPEPQEDAGAETDGIVFTNAWLRLPPRAAPVAAAYFDVENRGGTDAKLVSVSSPQFGRVEMHETVMRNNMMAMQEVRGLLLSAGKRVHFKPGGLHLMLFDAKEPIDRENHYELIATVETKSGDRVITIELDKRSFGDTKKTSTMNHH